MVTAIDLHMAGDECCVILQILVSIHTLIVVLLAYKGSLCREQQCVII